MSYWTYLNGNVSTEFNLTSTESDKTLKMQFNEDKKSLNKILKNLYKDIEKLKENINIGDGYFTYFINPKVGHVYKQLSNGEYDYKFEYIIHLSFTSHIRDESNIDKRITNIVKEFISKYNDVFSQSVVDIHSAYNSEVIIGRKTPKTKLYVFKNFDNLDILQYLIPNSEYNYLREIISIDDIEWGADKVLSYIQEFESILEKHSIDYIIKNVNMRW